MRAVCRRLAAAGFTIFAPDLYRGQIATTIEDAELLASQLNQHETQAKSDIARAVAYLSERDLVGPELGVIGFSLGAYYALALSNEDPDRVRAAVVFYGTGHMDYQRSQATYLGHFAEHDDFEPPSNVRSLEDALRAAGRPVTFHTYPGTGHWFFEQDRTGVYNQAAADLAWERTLAFLRRALPSPPGSQSPPRG
jgi:carboxymethylenebutenolidase